MTEADFLADILADPGADTPRLMYAAWLEDEGQYERAEFIRVQCDLARRTLMVKVGVGEEFLFRGPGGVPHCVRGPAELDSNMNDVSALRRREQELLSKNRRDWLKGIAWNGRADIRLDDLAWRRGFVEQIACTAEDWLAHADAILAAQPVRRVVLTTVPYFRTAPPIAEVLDGNTRLVRVPMPAEELEHRWPGIKFTLPRLAGLDPDAETRFQDRPLRSIGWERIPNELTVEGTVGFVRQTYDRVFAQFAEDGERLVAANDGEIIRVDNPVGGTDEGGAKSR